MKDKGKPWQLFMLVNYFAWNVLSKSKSNIKKKKNNGRRDISYKNKPLLTISVVFYFLSGEIIELTGTKNVHELPGTKITLHGKTTAKMFMGLLSYEILYIGGNQCSRPYGGFLQVSITGENS